MAKQKIITTESIEKRLAEGRGKQESMHKVEIEGVTIYADSEEEIEEIIWRTDRIRKIYEKALEGREELIRVWGSTKEEAAGRMLRNGLLVFRDCGRLKPPAK